MQCEHRKRIGDNYGLSCQDCGEQLEGYGYGGFFDTSSLTGDEPCIHVWDTSDPEVEECNYCFDIRDKRERVN